MGTATSSTEIFAPSQGIIPRVIQSIFQRIDRQKEQSDFMIRVSYLEIYNENVRDLLNPQTDPKLINIREDDKKGVVVVGVKEEVVTSLDDMLRCLQTGALYRTTGRTLMNEESSRSHSIFTIILEQKTRDPLVADGEYIMAKFHLVDLAGSERNKRTGAVGLRFKESVQINSGLLALGNVISALGDDKKRAHVTHVPYRESKLTRLLQDSLGGNSNTLMIACVSPADSNFEETLNTLKYANRARNIKNKPVINRDPHAAQLAHLRNQIQTLQLELLKHRIERDENGNPIGNYSLEELLQDEQNRKYLEELQNKTVNGSISGFSSPFPSARSVQTSSSQDMSLMREQTQSLTNQVTDLKEQLDRAQNAVSELSEDMFLVKSERDKIQLRVRELCQDLIQTATTMREIEASIRDKLNEKQRRSLHDIIAKIDHLAKRERFELDKSNRRVSKSSAAASPSGDGLALSPPTSARSYSSGSRPSTAVDKGNASDFAGFAPDSTNSPQMEAQLQQLQQELNEAKADLIRDEKIFAEKIHEVRVLRRTNAALKRENEQLKQVQQQVSATPAIQQQNQSAAVATSAISPDRPNAAPAPLVRPPRLPLGSRPATAQDTFSPLTTARSNASAAISSRRVSSGTQDLQLEELERELHQLDAERQQMERQKQRFESEKMQAEDIMSSQSLSFTEDQKKMEKSLKELTVMIALKEQLIRDLIKNEQDSKVEKQQYEQKIHTMEGEIIQQKSELEKVIRALEQASDMETARKEDEKQRIRLDYEAKLKQKENELNELKNRHREYRQIVKEKEKRDKQVRDLESEIGKLRSQQESLKRRLKEDAERQAELSEERVQQVAAMKREAEANSKRIRDLEYENQRRRAVLQRKVEELREQKEKNKAQAAAHAAAIAYAPSLARKQANEELDKQRAWLDREVEKHMRKKEAMQLLQKELAKREAIVREKEATLVKREQFERKRTRSSQVLMQSIADISMQIDTIDDEIKTKEQEATPAVVVTNASPLPIPTAVPVAATSPIDMNDTIAPSQAQDLHSQLMALKKMRLKAVHQRNKLQEKMQMRQTKDEALARELEERAEVLEAEIEYKNDAIAAVQQEIGSNTATVNIDLIAEGTPTLEDARTLLRRQFDKVIELKEIERTKDARIMELEVFIGERDKIIENLSSNLKLTEQVYERRLTKMQKESEVTIDVLTKQVRALQQQLANTSPSTSPTSAPAAFSSSGLSAVALSARSTASAVSGAGSSSAAQQGANENVDQYKNERIKQLENETKVYREQNQDLKLKLREMRTQMQLTRQQLLQQRSEHEQQLAIMSGQPPSMTTVDEPSPMPMHSSGSGLFSSGRDPSLRRPSASSVSSEGSTISLSSAASSSSLASQDSLYQQQQQAQPGATAAVPGKTKEQIYQNLGNLKEKIRADINAVKESVSLHYRRDNESLSSGSGSSSSGSAAMGRERIISTTAAQGRPVSTQGFVHQPKPLGSAPFGNRVVIRPSQQVKTRQQPPRYPWDPHYPHEDDGDVGKLEIDNGDAE